MNGKGWLNHIASHLYINAVSVYHLAVYEKLEHRVLVSSLIISLATPGVANPGKEVKVQWIDPVILEKLNAIKPVDRSKFKPEVINKIAEGLSNSTVVTEMTVSTVRSSIPGLNVPDAPTLVVKGKTKNPYQGYPPGAVDIQIVYDVQGAVIESMIAFPDPPSKRPGYDKHRFD